MNYSEYIETLVWATGQLDTSAYNALLRAASLGVPADEAMAIVAERIRGVGGELRMGKLRHQWECASHCVQANRAVRAGGAQPVIWAAPAGPDLEMDRAAVLRIASKVKTEITPAWLRERCRQCRACVKVYMKWWWLKNRLKRAKAYREKALKKASLLSILRASHQSSSGGIMPAGNGSDAAFPFGA